MKKSTIKRRKRVVPAVQDQSNDQSPRSFANSTSPETSPATLAEQYTVPTSQHAESMNLDQRQYEPPPIDFTGYQMSRLSHSEQQDNLPQRQKDLRLPSPFHPPLNMPPTQTHGSQGTSDHTRKRSFSIAEGTHGSDVSPDSAKSANRLSSISSILNHPQQSSLMAEDPSFDPNLRNGNQLPPMVTQPQQQTYMPTTLRPLDRSIPAQNDGRKAKLRKEAEDLREMLKAKERELELLGEG